LLRLISGSRNYERIHSGSMCYVLPLDAGEVVFTA
jgi:hypothetical protein